MKKFIMTTVIAACIALCADVWPPSNLAEETPAPPQTPTVSAPEVTVVELKTEVQTLPPAEKEKEAVLPTKASTETPAEPEPMPIAAPAASEVQPTTAPEMISEPVPEPVPEPTPEPPAQAAQMGDMVYVEGFGWIESQGPNRVEYAADMYENGNKIGIMG